jgi:methyl-accepting chemotaxis protein
LFSIRRESETETESYAARAEESLAELENIRHQVTQVLAEIKIMRRGSKEIVNGMTTMKNSKQESPAREATSRNILAGIQEMHDRAETIREITEYLAKMSDKLND